MRNPMQTAFWQHAYASLSPSARKRHVFHLQSAERWELRLDRAIELWSALGKALHAPRRAPTH